MTFLELGTDEKSTPSARLSLFFSQSAWKKLRGTQRVREDVTARQAAPIRPLSAGRPAARNEGGARANS